MICNLLEYASIKQKLHLLGHGRRHVNGMNYKKFRESKKDHFVTKDGRFTKTEIIKQLENWLTQRLGEPEDFFDKNKVKED